MLKLKRDVHGPISFEVHLKKVYKARVTASKWSSLVWRYNWRPSFETFSLLAVMVDVLCKPYDFPIVRIFQLEVHEGVRDISRYGNQTDIAAKPIETISSSPIDCCERRGHELNIIN